MDASQLPSHSTFPGSAAEENACAQKKSVSGHLPERRPLTLSGLEHSRSSSRLRRDALRSIRLCGAVYCSPTQDFHV